MNKKLKSPKRAPPRFRRIAVGQLWHCQKGAGHLVITGQVDEVTRETVLMRWLADGSLTVRPDAPVARYARRDLMFLERAARAEGVAG